MDRINPDSLGALWLTVGLVGFLAVASFMVSFTGLHEVAAWAGLPVWLAWTVPMFIDVAILAYTLAVLIHRHRGEKTWASWLSLAGFTLFSVIANGAHALSIPHPDMGQQIIGAATASMAPVAVFAATEQLGRLVIRRPEPPASMTSSPTPGETSVEDLVPAPAAGEHRTPEPDAVVPSREPHVPVESDGSSGTVPEVADHEVPGVGSETSEKDPVLVPPPVSDSAAVSRPVLSVVGRKPRPGDFEAWISSAVASGAQPTGKDASEFLGVSERTGRARLNALKKAKPGLFTGEVLAEGTNS